MKNPRHFFIILTLLVFALPLSAQTFEEYLEQENKQFEQFKQEKEEQIKKLKETYNTYIEEQDADFEAYLKKEWKAFRKFKGEEPPKKPKPKVIPEYQPEPDEPSPQEKPVKQLPTIAQVEIADSARPQLRIEPLIQKASLSVLSLPSGSVNFYGTPVEYTYDPAMNKMFGSKVSEAAIGKYWKALSETDYMATVNDLIRLQKQHNLNDYAVYLLIKQISEDITVSGSRESVLLSWFLLNRTGYGAKMAYSGDQLICLLPTEQKIYKKSYLTIDNRRYYIMEPFRGTQIYTYKQNYPEANRSLDLSVKNSVILDIKDKTRKISFEHEGEAHKLTITYNQNIIDLYNDLPLADVGIYFNAAVSNTAKESLMQNFYPLVNDKTETEAVNLLLKAIQTGFEYQTDQQQFGYEKFFFPEESLHYAACDCEDRSVLLAWLVRELLDLEVIGLEYPKHIATAVRFDKNPGGDYVNFQGEQYVVADPTYVNAPLGLTMAQYAGMQANVITLDPAISGNLSASRYWEYAHQAGAYRGGNLKDYVFDRHGNCYLTGYFDEKADFGPYQLNSEDGSRKFFVAKYDKSGELLWASGAKGKGTSTGFSITLNNNEQPVIAGSFKPNLSVQNNSLVTSGGQSDVFTALYSHSGSLEWINKAGIDTENHQTHFGYVAGFNQQGEHINTRLFLDDNETIAQGVFYENGMIKTAGSINSTTGLTSDFLAFNAGEEMNYPRLLKETNDKMIEADVETSIAGLFAVIDLIQRSGMIIPGSEAQKALDEYNPRFRQEYPDMFDKIGRVRFLKNKAGIITIQTSDGDAVNFAQMKVKDNARIKITPLAKKDHRIEVLSGMVVGKFIVWYDLNSITLHRKTGNLLFDYDDDHSQSLVNLEEDILN
ncbi:MAG: hypothetical protein K9I94_07955 [Bacteroidales bacterium]|nr:hypothetical protein [Bacteroidales bacterium]